MARRLLTLLDGTRGRAVLAVELEAVLAEEGRAPATGAIEELLETALERLAALGMLLA